ncbi:uncharacterized protein N7459_001025 [Penicillium hispanicum]|uniref:uncharacterized protein n=1 Tax=Penicillium hispanicum TaxID=1080232 RepID=UPI0025412D5B|nr:uncharacterized protein N7459_001025 [Penicillium hispanicum]KAJ5594817.1 hypothetical protein N7459_001025 [Penicillium hispanicum]
MITLVIVVNRRGDNNPITTPTPVHRCYSSLLYLNTVTPVEASVNFAEVSANSPTAMWGLSQQPLEIPGPQKLLKTVGSLWLSSQTDNKPAPGVSTTCSQSEVSCRTKYHGQDTCCFNYPGGQMLQTQFWDVDPAVGPDDSWTIHGLWPDHCNGGFDQFCDSRRKYSNISLILVDSGRGDLLEYMSEYWKDFRGDDANLWQHEWNKHGTCVSTLETQCYEDYLPQQEVVDYFDKTVEVFQQVPSYKVKDGKLAYEGNTTFYADKAPKGRVQSTIFTSQEEHPIELEITWKDNN